MVAQDEIDAQAMREINRFLFEGRGDDLFSAISDLVAERGLQVNERSLQRLADAVNAVRSATRPIDGPTAERAN